MEQIFLQWLEKRAILMSKTSRFTGKPGWRMEDGGWRIENKGSEIEDQLKKK